MSIIEISKLCNEHVKLTRSFSPKSKYLNSYGIICFCVNPNINIEIQKLYNISSSDLTYLEIIKLTDEFFINNIKILMIRRRYSLNFLQFVRGKYNMHDIENIKMMLILMSQEENKLIYKYDFDYLWGLLWCNNSQTQQENSYHKKEYIIAKYKFIYLKNLNFYNLFNSNILSTYLEAEWEFPKGKRKIGESNYECAIREFVEETNISIDNINILKNINSIEEKYIGTDKKYYRHVYYIAYTNTEINIKDIDNILEVDNYCWINFADALTKIRNYNNSKLTLLNYLYILISNLIIKIK